MFELLAFAAAVITVGVLASRSGSDEHEEPWVCSEKFSNMPKDVRDQAIAVMKNGTNAPAMLKFANTLRKGGFNDAAECVEARANELLGGKGVAYTVNDAGEVSYETARKFGSTPTLALNQKALSALPTAYDISSWPTDKE